MMRDGRVAVLCTGDVHLGRYPSHVPVEDDRFSVASVWASVVDRAIELAVDVVALTGDVVDRGNRYFEAIGPLERGLRRLEEAGIAAFAVAGNHDFDVLPKLADTLGIADFHLLGRGGRWETATFERDGKPALELCGWSFPSGHVDQSPLADLELDGQGDLPRIGLLHADLDQPNSPYAPVATTELQAQPVDAWLLGHIHRPDLRRTAGEGIILYPGSPQALDPGELGRHGPWLVEVAPGVLPRARQIPLATVCYRQLEIDLEGVDHADAFEQTVPQRIQQDLRKLAETAGPLQRVVYRLRYHGRSALHRELERLSQPLLDDLRVSFEEIEGRVDKVEVDTRPQIDLEDLAQAHDPPGILAALLLELQAQEVCEEHRGLLRSLRTQVAKVHGTKAYSPLLSDRRAVSDVPDEAEVRRLALAEGMMLLDELLAQKRRLAQESREVS